MIDSSRGNTVLRKGFQMLCICSGICALGGTLAAQTASQIVDQARLAYGSGFGSISDWTGQGQVWMTGSEKQPLDFTMVAKGRTMVQRTVKLPVISLRYGTDGKRSWQSSGILNGAAIGRVAWFIESLTSRSVASLFDNAAKGMQLQVLAPSASGKDGESSDAMVEADDDKGVATRYYFDKSTSLVNRIEFDTGTFQTPLFSKEKVPVAYAFLLSDYRAVNGIMTPFKIEVYLGAVKIEEMRFSSVQYNTGIADSQFAP
jgi:hypothetical protein